MQLQCRCRSLWGRRVRTAADLARQSGEALKEIMEMVDNAADQVRTIASEEQSATSEEIRRSVEQVNTIATDTAEAVRNIAPAVAELSDQALILTDFIKKMKAI